MQRKGQAAMEFLMTYGWAILAAIIAIGVLAYFGVFSPGKFVPSATVINAPLYANAWNIIDSASGTDTISIEIKNNGGDTLNINSVTLSNLQRAGATYTCTGAAVTFSLAGCNTDFRQGELCTATISCTDGGIAAGDTLKGDIAISYTKSGGSLPLSSTGTLADKAVAG